MAFTDFEKRLNLIKRDYNEIADKIGWKLLDSLSVIIEDINGVTPTWLTRIVDNHLITLFMQVNPAFTEKQAETAAVRYVWEEDFGGLVAVGGVSYDLSDDRQLYSYLNSLREEAEK